MPPYLRRFRGWDWFTPRAIQHLPWQEQERLTQEVWGAVRRHRCHWLMTGCLPLLSLLIMNLVIFSFQLKTSSLIRLLKWLAMLVFGTIWVGTVVWQRRIFREALRQKLLDAGLRPRICFECGYNVEGYEGKECPACDAPFLRQADSPHLR
ncbi:MAG TPA: hypothetical protein VN688_23915 [Gemmataceae bacterium]|nr:hypothetical protein [Gemmataceae bacterium]